jgi:hypothetical protein
MKGIVSLFFCLLVLVGCSDSRSKFRGQVLAGCIQGGGSKAICKCGFDKLESAYGDQLETTAMPQLSASFNKALLECRSGQSSSKVSPEAAADNFKAAFMQAVAPPNPPTSNERAPDTNAAGVDTNASTKALDRAITEQVNLRTRYGGGAEYRDGRKTIEIDFNRDGSRDAVVLYAIEGADAGNAVVQTLQLFFGSQSGYVAQGATIVESVADITLGGDGSILVHSLMHGPDDPDCCPSIRSSVRYRVEGNQLLHVP